MRMPDLTQAGLEWFRGLVNREGLLRAIAVAVGDFRDLAVDYLPSRRRLRYGDIDYDWDHRVETTWANPPLSVRLREIFTRGKYQPTGPELFQEVFERLPIRHEDYVYIDLGSGKGRTLLMASDYPFREIVGVEIIPELHETALRNIARYNSDGQRCSAISSILGDARAYRFPNAPILLYLFNPFPEDVLRDVLENLGASLREHPRPAWVVYHNLVHEDLFRRMPFLRRTDGTHQFAVYHAEWK